MCYRYYEYTKINTPYDMSDTTNTSLIKVPQPTMVNTMFWLPKYAKSVTQIESLKKTKQYSNTLLDRTSDGDSDIICQKLCKNLTDKCMTPLLDMITKGVLRSFR